MGEHSAVKCAKGRVMGKTVLIILPGNSIVKTIQKTIKLRLS